MFTLDRIVDSAEGALTGASSLQKDVRGYISEKKDEPTTTNRQIAESICEAVAVFRRKAERIGESAGSVEELQIIRKRANNIINDISRICREQLGYSIVNYKRSHGEWHYKPVEVEAPPAKAKAIPTVSLTKGMECPFLHFDASQHIAIPTSVAELCGLATKMGWNVVAAPSSPDDLIMLGMILRMSLEDIGRAVVKRAKSDSKTSGGAV